MKRDVDLFRYYPPHLQKSRQIVEIAETENPEFNLYWDRVERARNNLYILAADSYGLSKFEKLFDLHPLPTDSLESRRAVVLAVWNENIPYTLRQLEIWLTDMCGKNNYSVSLNPNEYQFSIEITTEDKYIYNSALTLLHRILPCNLVKSFFQITQVEKQLYLFSAVSTTNKYAYIGDYKTSESALKVFAVTATTNTHLGIVELKVTKAPLSVYAATSSTNTYNI